MPIKVPSRETIEAAIEAFKRNNFNATHTYKELGIPSSTFYSWLEIGARVYGLEIPKAPPKVELVRGRQVVTIENGVVLAGSDAHYWPGPAPTAHRALVRFAKREKNLRVLVMNGDAFDFSAISKYPPIGWTSIPTPQQEFEVVEERLNELVRACAKGVERFFPLGNHDARFETYIASKVPELKGIKGTSLTDHFPLWEPCWSLHINDHPGGLVIKHRENGGIHAPRNNTIHSGRSIATGHLHSQKITPFSDYNGTRWGIDLGCLADVYAPQFQDYMEDRSRDWRSGFARFKFLDGKLLSPELIRVVSDGVVEFRGELISV